MDRSKSIYLGEFDSKQEYPLIRNMENGYYDGFDVSPLQAIEISKLDIIVAAYNHESYEGDAFVLFRKDGKLYEVNDSHCSCNGLDGWEPEETTKEALLTRFDGWQYGLWKQFENELKEIIENL